jgi:hypothetical protein
VNRLSDDDLVAIARALRELMGGRPHAHELCRIALQESGHARRNPHDA